MLSCFVDIPKIFQTPPFNRLFMLSEINTFTPEEYDEYQKSITRMSDYYNIIDSAVARAEKIAREEGREEGKVDMCRAMLEKGISKESVAEIAGLSVSELNDLLSRF